MYTLVTSIIHSPMSHPPCKDAKRSIHLIPIMIIPLFVFFLLMGEYEFMKGLQYGRKVGGTTKLDVLLLGSYTRFSCSLT